MQPGKSWLLAISVQVSQIWCLEKLFDQEMFLDTEFLLLVSAWNTGFKEDFFSPFKKS